MADRADVIVYYSLQSDYCYFLLDRLLELQKSVSPSTFDPSLEESSAHLNVTETVAR